MIDKGIQDQPESRRCMIQYQAEIESSRSSTLVLYFFQRHDVNYSCLHKKHEFVVVQQCRSCVTVVVYSTDQTAS